MSMVNVAGTVNDPYFFFCGLMFLGFDTLTLVLVTAIQFWCGVEQYVVCLCQFCRQFGPRPPEVIREF